MKMFNIVIVKKLENFLQLMENVFTQQIYLLNILNVLHILRFFPFKMLFIS